MSASTSDSFLVHKLRQLLLQISPSSAPSQLLISSIQKSTQYEGSRDFPKNSMELKKFDFQKNPQNDGSRHNPIDFDVSELSEISDFKGNLGPLMSGTRNSTFLTVGQDPLLDSEIELRQNLNELIKLLKMSLNSGSHNMNQDGFLRSTTPGGGDLVTVNHPDLNLNLSEEDIFDLNNMMDGETEILLTGRHLAIIFCYFVIAVIAVIGNLLVVQLVIRSRRLHTITHALLANLAVADLIMAGLNVPFSASRVIMTEWPFGAILCQVLPFIQVMTVYVTSITMTVIALDRYQVIMNPLGRRMKRAEGVPLVILIWIISAILSLPYALNHKIVTILTVRVVKRCRAEFKSIESRQWLTVGTLVAQYLIPLILTTISYASIMHRLGQRSAELGSTTPRQVEAAGRAKRKTIKMLVLTVVFFGVCWAPINIYHLLTHFNLLRHNSITLLICHIIAMSSSCYNPFIYCGLNETFRREALRWAHCFRTRRSPIVHPGIEVNGLLTRADIRRTNRGNNPTSTIVQTLSLRTPTVPRRCCCEGSSTLTSSPIVRPDLLFITGSLGSSSIERRVIATKDADDKSLGANNDRGGKGSSMGLEILQGSSGTSNLIKSESISISQIESDLDWRGDSV